MFSVIVIDPGRLSLTFCFAGFLFLVKYHWKDCFALGDCLDLAGGLRSFTARSMCFQSILCLGFVRGLSTIEIAFQLLLSD